ncbi:phosphatidylglycerol phospholipase KNAG_0D01120 [Huiozyma naganishii CBS 8797]|uniref:GP-PDE domain-containing protein n=1 Tax=Huiozyma naganishii (strain ATCC MYA-139 / BCRC 22969 / CBS 8797 / KCTC 17520 / NBRC 10181 / NCYC 3082 / Yp74L-3) TaxID=1071383 RepID=J7S5I6_HUIN7|nr:hypothetical protein KNAG_0D01120 [Kazachstania naganishii CBS 8797]CCK69864.1 hypothetical protein KNAG_0D01120 [Kazachstania naganishii CBS 8797]
MVKVVGHRAFKALYPENTLLAFNKAVEGKVDIIETDLQMTKDGVVVVNHDSNTGRMWDRDVVVRDVDYDTITTLRCKEDPSLKMLTLVELLTWSLDHPEVQIMLDIKFTNKKIILIKTFGDMMKVKNDLAYWQEKIIWGLWMLDWYQYGIEVGVLHGFKIIVITMSLDLVEQFIQKSLEQGLDGFKLFGVSIHYVSSWTDRFREEIIPLLLKYDVKVFLWTVNKQIDFNYFVGLPIYGAIVDNPIQARTYLKTNDSRGDAKFAVPSLTSVAGMRFHAFTKLYAIICFFLYSSWAHVKVGGLSFAYLLGLLLRMVHFF